MLHMQSIAWNSPRCHYQPISTRTRPPNHQPILSPTRPITGPSLACPVPAGPVTSISQNDLGEYIACVIHDLESPPSHHQPIASHQPITTCTSPPDHRSVLYQLVL